MKNLFNRSPEKQDAPQAERRKDGGSFILELRCRGRRVRTMPLDASQPEITVGKAPDNVLQLPEGDRSSGAHHGVLRLTANGLKLTACDRQKIYFHGKALSEVVLKQNDRVSLGDSEIFVHPGASSDCRPGAVHRLETVGGAAQGQMVRLEKSPFRIGSAPDNDLVLNSNVISRHHAEIRMAENGETWLRDLGSSNGTVVNGERLGRQERMLMDSDDISFACFDYRFLDRSVSHTRAQFGRKMLVLAVTILLTLLIFGLFYMLEPTTETVINAVDFYLCRNNYDAAERVLKEMPDSRGFPRYERKYQEYRVQIPRYRGTWQAVLNFQSFLKESRWDDAADSFGKMELTEAQAWNQANPATEPKLKELTHAKELLDILMSLREIRTSLNVSIEDVKDFWQEISRRQAGIAAEQNAPEYLQPLRRTLAEEMTKLDFDIKTLQEIERKLQKLTKNGDSAQLTELIQLLEARLHQVSGGIRIYLRDLSARLQVIQKNMKALDENDQALFDLRLADLRRVDLISSDDCMMVPQLYLLRQLLEKRQTEQLRVRDQWNGLQKLLQHYQFQPGRIPDEIKLFSDEKRMEEIIARFDASPQGAEEYERIFGSRYFYEVLQQSVHSTNNIYASDLIPDMKTVPLCIRLKDFYRGISEVLAWFKLPQNQWLLQGRMKETRDSYQQILATRSNILQAFTNIASRHRDTRQYFIAKTAYFFFAPVRPHIPGEMLEFAAEWRKFRMRQQAWLEQYDPLDAGKSGQILEKIIANGIPGDPVFNWVRVMRRNLPQQGDGGEQPLEAPHSRSSGSPGR